MFKRADETLDAGAADGLVKASDWNAVVAAVDVLQERAPVPGPAGPQGEQGPQGQQGLKGDTGAAGVSPMLGLKCEVLAGVTAGVQGEFVTVAHGLLVSKIVGMSLLVGYGVDAFVCAEYGHAVGYACCVQVAGPLVRVVCEEGKSGKVLNKPFVVMVWYVD